MLLLERYKLVVVDVKLFSPDIPNKPNLVEKFNLLIGQLTPSTSLSLILHPFSKRSTPLLNKRVAILLLVLFKLVVSIHPWCVRPPRLTPIEADLVKKFNLLIGQLAIS